MVSPSFYALILILKKYSNNNATINNRTKQPIPIRHVHIIPFNPPLTPAPYTGKISLPNIFKIFSFQ
jgi:hypothetical protein